MFQLLKTKFHQCNLTSHMFKKVLLKNDYIFTEGLENVLHRSVLNMARKNIL